MVITTPADKSSEHKFWHTFRKGGCLYCGYYCDDCPIGVATCKCVSGERDKQIEEAADELLKQENSGTTDSWRE